jgi:hypothetical protein
VVSVTDRRDVSDLARLLALVELDELITLPPQSVTTRLPRGRSTVFCLKARGRNGL